MSAWTPPPPAGAVELCTVPCTEHICYLPECADPVGVCRRKVHRRCPGPFASYAPAKALDRTPHYDDESGAGHPPGSPRATAAHAHGVFGLGGATAAAFARTGSALGGAGGVLASALTLPTGCPVCGLEPPAPRPGLKLPKAVADWLVRYAGGRFAAADFRPHIPTDASQLLMCDAKSDGFQSGLEVGQLLAAVLARGGKSLPFAPELLRSDATPRSLLRNWSLLEPCLAAYGVELRPDDKALIVAGEREPVAALLTELKERIGVPAYATPGQETPPPSEAGEEAPSEKPEETPEEAEANERKELLTDSITQLVGLYSIVMACLLTLFVEQQCPGNASNPEPHACSLSHDFSTHYELAVIGVNFACLFVFVIAQTIFWLREKFIIDHFEEDIDLPGDNLPNEICKYPAYLYGLRVQNKRAYYAAELVFMVLLVNFGLSASLILDKRYAGRTSIIGLLSNTFLCLGKVYGYRTLAKQSMDTDMAISLFESEAKNKNTIEPDKRRVPGVYDEAGAAQLQESMRLSRSAAVAAKAAAALPQEAAPRGLTPAKGRERWGASPPMAVASQPSATMPPARTTSTRSARGHVASEQPPPPPPGTRRSNV